jgi:hypothetical protein
MPLVQVPAILMVLIFAGASFFFALAGICLQLVGTACNYLQLVESERARKTTTPKA